MPPRCMYFFFEVFKCEIITPTFQELLEVMLAYYPISNTIL